MDFKFFNYTNGTTAKLKNRRVHTRYDNKEVCIQFVRLLDEDEDIKPAATSLVFKNKILVTTIKLSDEAVIALHYSLGRYLESLQKANK